MNTLPTSKNHEMRVESLSSLTNGVGKMISAEPTVLNAPPIGNRQLTLVDGQVASFDEGANRLDIQVVLPKRN